MERQGTFGGYDAINQVVSFKVGKLTPVELENLIRADLLDIKAEKHREKRSLSANSYFHVLVGKIADVLRVPDIDVKNRLIRDYGAWMYVNGVIPTYAIHESLVEDLLRMEGMHWVVVDRVMDDGKVKMALKRGSHTYNSKEMARLIDGTVQEAKELGIEVLPPDTLAKMIAEADERKGKNND